MIIEVPSVQYNTTGVFVRAENITCGDIQLGNASSSTNALSGIEFSSTSPLYFAAGLDKISFNCSAFFILDIEYSLQSYFNISYKGNGSLTVASTNSWLTFNMSLETEKFSKYDTKTAKQCTVTAPSALFIEDCDMRLKLGQLSALTPNPSLQADFNTLLPKIVSVLDGAGGVLACTALAGAIEGSVSDMLRNVSIDYIVPDAACDGDPLTQTQNIDFAAAAIPSIPLGTPVEQLEDLEHSSLIDAVAFAANDLIGINGKLPINKLMNLFTKNTGVFTLDSATTMQLVSNLEVTLDALRLEGINSWSKFNVFETLSKYVLSNELALDRFVANFSFSLAAFVPNHFWFNVADDLSSVSVVQGPNTATLTQTMSVAFNMTEFDFGAVLQMLMDGKKLRAYSDAECQNVECLLALFYNGTEIREMWGSLMLNSFAVNVKKDTDALEVQGADMVNNAFNWALKGMDRQLTVLISSILSSEAKSGLNSAMSPYLNGTCSNVDGVSEANVAVAATVASFSAFAVIGIAVLLISVFFVGPKGHALRKDFNKQKDEENKCSASASCDNLSASASTTELHGLEKSDSSSGMLSQVNTLSFAALGVNRSHEVEKPVDQEKILNSSLFMHPRIPQYLRVGVPCGVFIAAAFYISSNCSVGASVYALLQPVGDKEAIVLPSLFSFGLINSITDMWEAKVYPLSIIIALFSGAWPYIKLIMMLVCWFLPKNKLTVKKRELLLMALDALGKWSMIDSFMMVMMVRRIPL